MNAGAASAVGGVGAQNCASGAPTRLQSVLSNVSDAKQRIYAISERMADMNKQMIGSSGPPPQPQSAEKMADGGNGVVGYLEQACSDLHAAITELDTLVGFQRELGVVA